MLDPEEPEQVRHARLAGAGPFDLIVDESGAAGCVDRFRSSFLHLRPGGRYRVPSADVVGASALRTLVETGTEDDPVVARVDQLVTAGRWLEVRRKGRRTLAKVSEAQMNTALAADPARGRVLESIAAARLESRCVVRASRVEEAARARPRFDAPELFLREYVNVVCRPKAVVIQRGLLAPDTFRHPAARELRTGPLRDAGTRFAVAPRPTRATPLDGVFFHLDNEKRGYYGHALTDQMSKVWAWPRVKARYPDARVLVSLNKGRALAEWEWVLFEAAGIARDEVVVIAGPVRVERLIGASPMFSLPRYVHPEVTGVWDAIGTRLRAGRDSVARPKRVFLSRRHEKRTCLNRDEVERLFTDFGFSVIFPEDHPLQEQASIIHEAEVVAGFAGSGMFTTMFSDRPKHVVLVRPDTYRPINEEMIGAVRGHRLDVAIGTTPADLPVGVDPRKPLRWPFTLDMRTDGAWLRAVLDDL